MKTITNKKVHKTLPVTKIGSIDIEIPMIQVGEAKPKVLLMTGIHGDEISGLFIIKQLINDLELNQGQLDVIPSANPLAQAMKQRKTPLDNKDLNRNFNTTDHSITEQIADTLLRQLQQNYDLVIDLHTLENRAPIVGIFINHGNEKVKKESMKHIQSFDPEIVWQIDTKSKLDKELDGCLGPKLSEKQIPNFVIEVPEHYRLTQEHISKSVSGLKRVLSNINMIDEQNNTQSENRKTKIFKRKKVKAQRSGIFTPKKNLLEQVEAGDEIGEITSIDNFETGSVLAEEPGTIMILNDRDLAMPGDLLFSIGKEV